MPDQVYAWGANSMGQLGTKRMDCVAIPTKVEHFTEIQISQIACSKEHTHFITGKLVHINYRHGKSLFLREQLFRAAGIRI